MSKKQTWAFCIISVLLVLTFTVSRTSADNRQEVLGETDAPPVVQFPPIGAGPGYILPDSPFYFLDKLSQSIKLALAFTPQRRVEISKLIIGERMAELRVESSRNNSSGMHTVLKQLNVDAVHLANIVKEAAAQKGNIAEVAKDLNDTLSYYRSVLATVAAQSSVSQALNLEAASQELLATKLTIENYLPEDQQLIALNADLEDQVQTQVLGIETSSNKLQNHLLALEKQASRAADKLPENIIKELKDRRKELKDKKQLLREEYLRRKEQLITERKKLFREAQDAAKRAKEAAVKLKMINTEISKLNNTAPSSQ